MALSRRTGQRFQASIWPGFVDAMTGLLLVLMFLLTIFMVVQFVLRETISGQETEIDSLSIEVSALAAALGLEERRTSQMQARLGALNTTLDDTQTQLDRAQSDLVAQSALVASLTAQRDQTRSDLTAAQSRIVSFEEQVAGLLAARDTALDDVAALQQERAEILSREEALNLALAQSRTEIDAQTEAARLAAAQREALEALVADLQTEGAELTTRVDSLQEQLNAEELARLTEAAAAQALRERLENADAELTAMTLALEAQRQDAEDTLTLLAAAAAAQDELDARLAAAMARIAETTQAAETDQAELRAQLMAALAAQAAAEADAEEQLSLAQQRAALLATANQVLSEEEAMSAEAQREAALLNQQVAALRSQLGNLQGLLDEANAKDAAAQVQLQSLGSNLNTALARVAAEERRRRELEEAERARLEEEAARLTAEAEDLEQYRSEFFGQLRAVLGGQEGVQIVGDRFVFASEVLFPPASADLSFEGRAEIAKVVDILSGVTAEIPQEIDWVIQVDGHTDNQPLSGFGEFRDNWELSQARALSVVRFMSTALGVPPDRLSANGFGEYQPVNRADTAEARAQNRRIELKFTEK